ncbi:MAG: SH3 domain-containing protein [Leptolyngbya sp. RL_3_1]|nr:SH3 domain-containing protein [Leptolyngbya sp. RL_3_1]
MKIRPLLTAACSVILFALTPAIARSQTLETCFIGDDDIPVGEAFAYHEPEPAYIFAENVDSVVNVRSGPGTEYGVLLTKAPEDYVNVMAQAFSSECATWLQVEAPITGATGWVHADYVRIPGPPRGFWT